MLAALSSIQAAELLAFADEPIGEERSDYRAAQIAVAIAAAAGAKDLKLEDFLLKFSDSTQEAEKPDPAVLRHKADFIFAVMLARGVPRIPS